MTMQMSNEERRAVRRQLSADIQSAATEALGLWSQIRAVRAEIARLEKMPPTFDRTLQIHMRRERLGHLISDHAMAQARRRRLSGELAG
jgi:hypothetical protein